MGVPLGSTLNDFFIALLQDKIDLSRREQAKSHLRHYRYMWRRPRYMSPAPDARNRLFMCTWLDEKASLRDLMLPVIDGLGHDRCTVIGKSFGMRGALPSDTPFITFAEAHRFDLGAWRRLYTNLSPAWERRIARILGSSSVSQAIGRFLNEYLVVQSQRVMAMHNLLEALQPSVVVTEYDRNVLASCLILAAKAQNIATVTLLHGVINPPYGYTPLLADQALCWGPQHRSQLMALGEPDNKLLIAGCPRLSQSLNATRASARAKLGFSTDLPLVLLATNPINRTERFLLADAFCRAATSLPRVIAAVRLHPSEKLDDYQETIAAFPSVRVLQNHEWTLDESLAAADMVVCRDSGFGNDALVKGRPVLVLQPSAGELANGLSLVQDAGMPLTRNSHELSQTITRYFEDAAFRQQLDEAAKRYAVYFCTYFNGEAVIKTTEIITANIGKN